MRHKTLSELLQEAEKRHAAKEQESLQQSVLPAEKNPAARAAQTIEVNGYFTYLKFNNEMRIKPLNNREKYDISKEARKYPAGLYIIQGNMAIRAYMPSDLHNYFKSDNGSMPIKAIKATGTNYDSQKAVEKFASYLKTNYSVSISHSGN